MSAALQIVVYYRKPKDVPPVRIELTGDPVEVQRQVMKGFGQQWDDQDPEADRIMRARRRRAEESSA